MKSFLLLTATSSLPRNGIALFAYKAAKSIFANSNRFQYNSVRRFSSLNNNQINDQNHIKSIICKSSEDIESLGCLLADIVDDVDVLFLQGDLGAGKTTLSRGLIRTMFDDQDMIVTSPSYLLDNCYQYNEDRYIHHIDLYRLPIGCDMNILNIPSIFTTSLCLIEWPNRLSMNIYPESYLDITISITKDDEQYRIIQFKAIGSRWINKQQQFNDLLETFCSIQTNT